MSVIVVGRFAGCEGIGWRGCAGRTVYGWVLGSLGVWVVNVEVGGCEGGGYGGGWV